MLDPVLSHWLDAEAEALDLGHSDPQHVLSQLASANVLRVGISPQLGGTGGNLADAQWLKLGRLLEAHDALARDEHGGVRLGPTARDILKGGVPVAVRKDDWAPERRVRAKRSERAGASSPPRS